MGLALRPLLPDATFLSRVELDVTDGPGVERAVARHDVVVHLAGLTHVDRCEQRPDEALTVNGKGTAYVVDGARAHGSRVLFVSTDYVFDGTKDGEYTEDDFPNPINQYGRSKLEGERHVLSDERNLVVRSSWVFGRGRNFVATVLSAARAGRRLRVVADQRGRPTAAHDLARALAELVSTDAAGIVHVAGDGPPCTWADLAEAGLRAAGIEAEIERVDTATYERGAGKAVAPRPKNSVLSIEKARRLGLPLGDWPNSLRRYVKEMS
jgi:dTDP-4-dehydrorhamnose reductase